MSARFRSRYALDHEVDDGRGPLRPHSVVDTKTNRIVLAWHFMDGDETDRIAKLLNALDAGEDPPGEPYEPPEVDP